MPCRCDGFEQSNRGSSVAESQYNALLAEANWATRSACDMRTILRRNNLEEELTEETRRWIGRHDLADARRIEEENARGERQRVKTEALGKLTDEDRSVLGLPAPEDIWDRRRRVALDKLSLEERRVLGL